MQFYALSKVIEIRVCFCVSSARRLGGLLLFTFAWHPSGLAAADTTDKKPCE